MVKCERWIQDERSKESATSWWLNRLIGRTKKSSLDWPYPFVENRMFILTLTAGLEGYHVMVLQCYIPWFNSVAGGVCRDLGLRMRLAYH